MINVVKIILQFNKQQKDQEFKILTLRQMLQRLPIDLSQVEPGNTSENLLCEIRQIVYYCYLSKEIPKNINIYNSFFMNSENSET